VVGQWNSDGRTVLWNSDGRNVWWNSGKVIVEQWKSVVEQCGATAEQ